MTSLTVPNMLFRTVMEKKHLRFKDVSIECRVALAIAQVLGLNPTKKHKKPLENLKRCFTDITQPPHVALYQIQLPGQKSDKTRSFHSRSIFQKKSPRGFGSGKVGEAAEVDEKMNAADFLSGVDWSIICFILSCDGIKSSRDWPKCWTAPTGPTDSPVFRMINA